MEELNAEDLRFLKNLNDRLVTVRENTDTRSHIRKYEDFHSNQKVSQSEAETLIDLVRSKDDLYISPANVNFGFSVGFRLVQITKPSYPNLPIERKYLFACTEKQLPKGYRFEELKPLFMNKENLEGLLEIGVKINPNRARYEY